MSEYLVSSNASSSSSAGGKDYAGNKNKSEKALVRVQVDTPEWAELAVILAVIGSWAIVFGVLKPEPQAIVVYFVPMFITLMCVEWALVHVTGLAMAYPAARYHGARAWSSIAAGMTQQMFSSLILRHALANLSPWLGGDYIFANSPLRDFIGIGVWDGSGTSFWHHAVYFLAADLSYYWFHRNAHQIAFLWAGHHVHHSSESYNFATALRQSSWQAVTGEIWKLPWSLLIDPHMFVLHHNCNVVYQFWVHTTIVKRLGPLEWIFSTPSHHRIHHDRRLHKNFGGVLIIWDRLFGTFQDEENIVPRAGDERTHVPGGAVVYGTGKPVSSFTDSVAQHEAPLDLLRRAHAAASNAQGVTAAIRVALRVLIRGPGWVSASKARTLYFPSPDTPRFRLRTEMSPIGNAYIIVQLFLTVGVGFGCVLAYRSTLQSSAALSIALFGATASSMYIQGTLFDGRRWAAPAEATRCTLLAGLCAYVAHQEQRKQHPGMQLPSPQTLNAFAALMLCCAAFCIFGRHMITGSRTLQLREKTL